jgi:hypothetical protein
LAIQLTDAEIVALLTERKSLPVDYESRLRLRPKRGHREQELEVTGDAGGEYRLILREAVLNPLDFSIILGYRIPGTNQVFRLRRHNGRSHTHSNKLEGDTFYDFHIHIATERYQASGLREDTFASVTDRYADFDGALRTMLRDGGFEIPPKTQTSLFEGG